MNDEVEKYIQEINRRLSDMPKQDREDILLEIKNHVYEATEKGKSTAQILAGLGAPAKLAQAYSFGYRAEYQKLKPSDIFNSLTFYGLAGLSGIIVIPTLSVLAITFAAVAIFIPAVAVMNFFGITQIPMFIWGEASIPPGMVQLVLCITLGALFLWLAFVCWRGLKKYIKVISAKYRKLKLG